jgi:23S rRNA pseudouridine1911/1915/1917 synthase
LTERLDLALIRRHPQLSRRKAQDVISKGQVSVDGQTVQEPGRAVGERAAIAWDPNRKAERVARISLPLLHADEWLIVVDKPAGLLTVPSGPGASHEDTVAARAAEYARHRNPGRPFVGLAHRLDRDTSGALVVALDPAVRQSLRALFRAHRIERRYLALVTGDPRQEQGSIDLPIADRYEGGRRRVAREGEPAREALTRFRVRERFRGAALLEVELETGRQHQIRLHLSQVGLPVLGDPAYADKAGPRPPVAAPRQMLHAALLGFTHPVTGLAVRVESPMPADFARVLGRLRGEAFTRRLA